MEHAEHERDVRGINAVSAVLHSARVVGSVSLVGVRVNHMCNAGYLLVICWLSAVRIVIIHM